MSAHQSHWFNFDYSMNPFQAQESSQNLCYRNNQNSMSYLAKNSAFEQQQSSIDSQKIRAIFDNLLPKPKKLQRKKELSEFSFSPISSLQQIASQFTPLDGSQVQCSGEALQLSATKGLKNLAKLMILILKKKKFDSSKYLTEQIQDLLINNRKLSKIEHTRQSKNIRRRTYDALNVMIAANVLGPDLAFVRRVNAQSFTRKCASFIGQKSQIQTKFLQVEQRINLKKQFLKVLKQKKDQIQWWMNKKKQQSQILMNQKNKQQIQNISEKTKIKKSKQKIVKLIFPLVFVAQTENQIDKVGASLQNESVLLNFQYKEIQLFSQIQCFKILKGDSFMVSKQIQSEETQQKHEIKANNS